MFILQVLLPGGMIKLKSYDVQCNTNQVPHQILQNIPLIISSINAKQRSDLGLKKHTQYLALTHWGRMIHICVSNLTIIGSDIALSRGWHQDIIGTNSGILLIGFLERKLSEILIEIHTFSLKKIHLKMSSGKWQPFCLGLNVLVIVTYMWP